MPLTPQQQLDLINAQIAQIVTGGQRTKTPGGTEVERVDLETLMRTRDRLQAEVSPEQSGQSMHIVPVALGRLM